MKRQGYAVIMAGGKGTRFWPLSRRHHPKQILKIMSRKSLIRETADRTLPLFGRKNTLVVTVAEHYSAVRRELPILPRANFIVEPQGNNTAPCIGLAAVELARRDAEAVMTILPADHWVANLNSFLRTVKSAIRLAKEHDALVTIGIRPDYPETGYGYILKGEKIKRAGDRACYRVRGFHEKPTLKKAGQLMRIGSLWNSGIFVWKVSTILEMLRRFSPSIFQGLERIQKATRGSGPAGLRSAVRREYRRMPNISIDYAVLEKAGSAGRVLTLEGDFGWSDVGNWAAVHRMLPQDKSGNAGIGKWLGFRSKDCLVYSPDRLVALLGIQGIVVVDTADALLVADIKRSQEVKDLVEELKRKGHGRYTVR
ncbi:MAG: sugar phosphate nucleotidyltransferase [Candidatus Binatota bacterium]